MKKIFIFLVLLLISSCIFAQTANITNGGTITIIDVIDVIPPLNFTRLEENMKLVAFEILIDNTNGNTDINFTWGGIEVRDSQGFSYIGSASHFDLKKPALPARIYVESGGLLRGWFTFAIHQDSPLSGLRIRINSSFYGFQSDWVRVVIE